jgi:predicted DNA binding CopG/RHH family protein
MSKRIKTGKVDLPADEFEPKSVKVRISMMIPGDVLDGFKKLAKKSGKPYQVLMQEKLRESLFGPAEEERIRAIVREELKKAV